MPDYDLDPYGDEIEPPYDYEDRDIDEEYERDHRSYDDDDDDGYLIDDVGFADPGGVSALRAATSSNPRNLPCPTCHRPNVLTPADVARGYQCDRCADRAERGLDY